MSDLLQFTADVELQAASSNGKAPRVSILAYGGDVMTVGGHGPVVVDLQGMTIPASLPLLSDHNANIAGIVGSATPTKNAGKLVAEGTLSAATEAGKTLLALHRDGVKFQASIGASPGKRRYIREGESIQANGRTIAAPLGGFHLVESSILKEISITALAADSATSVAIAAQQQKDSTMPDTQTTPVSDPVTQERQRVQAIRAAFRGLGDDADVRCDQMIESGASEIEAQQVALEMLRASRSAPVNASITTRSQGADGRSIAEAGLLMICGYESAAEKIAGGRAIEAARGANLTNLRAWADYSNRLNGVPADAQVKAGFSTASLSVLMSSIPKMLLSEFEQSPASCDALADWRAVSDFKEQSLYRLLVLAGGLEEVAGDGEIKHGVLGEAEARIKLGTYAKMFQITRQAIINDDIGALSTIPRVLVMEAARLRGEKFAALLADNPGTFFGAGNANDIDDTLDADGLDAALLKLRTQTDADGRALGLTPTSLLVHPAQETTARALLNSTELSRDSQGDRLPTGNAFRSLNLRLEVEPRLNTTTEWYLFSRNTDAAVVIGTLNGRRTPTVEMPDAPANVLGEVIRGYYDFAIVLAEPRAAVRSTGTNGG